MKELIISLCLFIHGVSTTDVVEDIPLQVLGQCEAELAPYAFDSWKETISSIEGGRYVRTEVYASNSTAFGPHQITSGKVKDMIKGVIELDLTEDERSALHDVYDRQVTSYIIGGHDRWKYEADGPRAKEGMLMATKYGYSSLDAFLDAFDYGGDLGLGDSEDTLRGFDSASEKLLFYTYWLEDEDDEDAALHWHGGAGWSYALSEHDKEIYIAMYNRHADVAIT